LAALPCLAILVACQRERTSLTYDFTASFRSAKVETPTTQIDFGSPQAVPLLTAGWSVPENKANGGWTWAVSRQADVRLVLPNSNYDQIAFRCWPFTYAGAGPQTTEVSINSQRVGAVTLKPEIESYVLDIPRGVLRIGGNLVQFRFSYVSVPHEVDSSSTDVRPLAVAFLRLEIRPTRDSPDIHGSTPSVTAFSDRIVQDAQTQVVYTLHLPGAPVLAFGLELSSENSSPTTGVQASVLVRRESLPDEVVFSSERSAREIKVDLGPYAGSIIGLVFSTMGPPNRKVSWVRPRLLGAMPGLAPSAPAVSKRPPNIVLISLDTLRRDALEKDSDDQPIMPFLRSLSASSVLFTQAFAPAVFTLTSHMSMFTGLYPSVHKVLGDNDVLSHRIFTLPEYLRYAGYRTLGVVSNPYLAAGFGFGRGFDRYVEMPDDIIFADRVNKAAVELLRTFQEDPRPLFLFVHYNDAHSDWETEQNRLPYFSPLQYRTLAVTDVDETFCDPNGVNCVAGSSLCGACATHFLLAVNRGRVKVTDQQIRRLRELYNYGARYLDDYLRKFIGDLKEAGLYDETVLVVTADHGEEFFEHGKFLHDQTYGATSAVPLIVKLPRGAHGGRSVAQLVDLVDITPTILELGGLSVGASLEGRSLLGLITGDGNLTTAPLHDLVLLRDQRGSVGLRSETKEFLLNPDSRVEVYDLHGDPLERVNIALEHPDEAARLQRLLREELESERRRAEPLGVERPSDSRPVLTEAQREQLRALGYGGSDNPERPSN
jgi:arylsulfatase A-like enzyme